MCGVHAPCQSYTHTQTIQLKHKYTQAVATISQNHHIKYRPTGACSCCQAKYHRQCSIKYPINMCGRIVDVKQYVQFTQYETINITQTVDTLYKDNCYTEHLHER
ncbi:hypothetical protein NP493_857g00007 [Ridgeia piscesae]|uniref:Uncharacterized protein n=1 Tax=Ridgeia piscesae TaxID=27915 RepID=A0AAD9KM57_RIDPI|nr:hypothetical protein NP493_857g00007 [Ridgeia piscesae]